MEKICWLAENLNDKIFVNFYQRIGFVELTLKSPVPTRSSALSNEESIQYL